MIENILINRIFTFFVNIFFVKSYLLDMYDEYAIKKICICDNKAILTQETVSMILDKYPLFFDSVDLHFSDKDVTHKLVIKGPRLVFSKGQTYITESGTK